MVIQLRQVAGVEQVKVVDFKQGLFALTPTRGASLSRSAIAAAVRRSGFTLARIVGPAASSNGTPAASPGPPGPRPFAGDMAAWLAEPREAFRGGDYPRALRLMEARLAQLQDRETAPNAKGKGKDRTGSGDLYQFLSLTHFAAGQFAQSADAAHRALHRESPWPWRTLSGYYRKREEYESQLRGLEDSIREAPTAEKRFLVGYHYMMLGYTSAARSLLAKAARQRPEDQVIARLLKLLESEQRP